MRRIQHGRAKTAKTAQLSIAAVAREAGVSASLIHNHYQGVAEDIRQAAGRASRAQRDAKQGKLRLARDRNRELRAEIARLELLVRNLASENEVLVIENRALRKASNTLVFKNGLD